jgi:choline monooxygenase
MTLLNSSMVDADIARASTLPAPFYFDRDIAAKERDRIFARTWQLIGHRDQVANPGDYFTTHLVGEPLLVVRGTDQQIRTFYNVCRHRAGPPAEGCGSRKLFRCAYHGWTYNLDGWLNQPRRSKGSKAFAPKTLRWCQCAAKSGSTLVFVNLDPTPARSARASPTCSLPSPFRFCTMKLF